MTGTVQPEITVTRSGHLPFAQVAVAVARRSDISPSAKALYMVLCTYADVPRRDSFPKRSTRRWEAGQRAPRSALTRRHRLGRAARAVGQAGRAVTPAQVYALPVVIDVPTAPRALGLGSTLAYELAKRGKVPCPVLRVGRLYKVPRAGLIEVLGLGDQSAADAAGPVLPLPPISGARHLGADDALR